MAIKTISRLNAFDNATAAGQFGGRLYMYKAQANDLACSMIDQPKVGTDLTELTPESDTYFNSLIELSKPIDAGTYGQTSQDFDSQKITYGEFVKNVVVDVKTYLNRRNKLGDFNLCAIVHSPDGYSFSGDKTFYSNIQIKNNGSNGNLAVENCANIGVDCSIGRNCAIGGNCVIEKDLTVRGATWLSGGVAISGDLDVDGNAHISKMLKVDSGSTLKGGNTLNGDSNKLGAKIYNGASIDDGLNITGKYPGTNYGLKVDSNGAYIGGPLTVTGDTSLQKLTAGATSLASLGVTNGTELNTLTVKGGATIYGNGQYDLTVGSSGNGKIKAGECTLTASSARWSDLAEYYLGDKKYSPGTLVKFGGSKEITVADGKVNAVITSKPAYLMNSGLKKARTGCAIALAGRVPVRITGKIQKFDDIVSNGDGTARRRCVFDRLLGRNILGKALEGKDTAGEGLIECVVRFVF